MRARLVAYSVSFCLAASLLAACGGGGGGGAASLPPVSSTAGGTTITGGGSSAPASVAISIAIPSASSASSSKRRVRYISAATKSATVSYAGTSQTTNCDSACTIVATVTPGTVTFALSLYDAPNGTGHVLSTGQTTTTIVGGASNTVKVTFGAVVASVAVALGASSVSAGTPATIPVTVTAKDAAGYTVVGSDPYATPITLSSDDASGATSLSTTSVAAPGTPVNLVYTGRANVSAVHLSASIAGTPVATSPATLSVQTPPASTPPPVSQPAGSVPSHVATWYYYGLNDMNASIPAAWMAAHADYVEVDAANDPSQARAFKAAGGKYAVSYTDPAYSSYCSAPFTAPAGGCQGPIGSLVSGDESAWLHGADGARVHKYLNAHYGYQEALNPASASARNAYRTATSSEVAAAPQLDYFFADDSGGVFNGSDGTQLTGLLYNFNAASKEIADDASFVAAEKQMLASAARPVFVNGATPYTLQPSYGGAFLKAPNVAGQNFEGCFGDDSGVIGDTAGGGPRWTNMSNALLAAYGYGAPAVCMNLAPATPANRLFVLASWWLTYDPARSIIAAFALAADGSSVLPEFDVVPRQPLQTASSSVASLRSGGAYVREFGACYQAGAPIGPCAAVVNPSSSPVAVPALSGHYTSALALDANSAYAGGKAAWSGTVPGQLGPQSAIIVR
jgi:hypothetical protein